MKPTRELIEDLNLEGEDHGDYVILRSRRRGFGRFCLDNWPLICISVFVVIAFTVLASRAHGQVLPAQLEAKTYTITGDVRLSNQTITGVPGSVITGSGRLYIRNDAGPDNVTLRGFQLRGVQIYTDKAGSPPARNENITLDNIELIAGAGFQSKGVGVKNLKITNCLAQGHPGHPFYGDAGYEGVTIANTEIIDCRGGTHFDAPIGRDSTNFLYDQVYSSGWSGISLELQGQAVGIVIQDSRWDNPKVINPGDLAAISVPNDRGRNVRILRNRFPNGITTWQVEAGAMDALYADNCFGNSVNKLAVRVTSRFPWGVTVKHNNAPGDAQFKADNTLGVLTVTDTGPTVELGWDINRRPSRNHRFGDAPPVVTPPAQPTTNFSDFTALQTEIGRLRMQMQLPLKITGGVIDPNTGAGTITVSK